MEIEDPSTSNREDLENAWRQQLERKETAYRKAQARYRQLMRELSEAHSPDHLGSAVKVAHEAAAQSLREYSRVLRIFTALTVDNKLPKEMIARECHT